MGGGRSTRAVEDHWKLPLEETYPSLLGILRETPVLYWP
jgi:hypothetical protein